ncbi:M20/M25/M40 family metallo-hydrolase [Lachnoclostridium sp. Marseille-P6806]|uniref:M20/M25/M40 family metallo-hydrolase n=1 Tax=Lachnoclostridium sp. Marseille-P6806 TaxID=2364793 RepID=UPI0013EF14B1|nr:M20/M25/M40 family metallo-hydrolase [Lachnoclostridium sp. Marseille-P6806]
MGINRERLKKQFAELISIDSVSFRERAMADYLRAALGELGIEAFEDDAAGRIGGNAGNLYAYFYREDFDPAEEMTPQTAPVLFCAHMDTVSPGTGKRAVFHEDGRITSDGTTVLGTDDAAAIAEILEALRGIVEEGLPHRNIELLFTAAEEAYTAGSSAFDVSHLRARTAYTFDVSGPAGTVSGTEPTLVEFRVRITGRASHAGFEPEKGVSAIVAASRAIACLPSGRIDPYTTFNIGQIEGGTGLNIVPEEVCIGGEIRSLSDETVRLLCREMQAAFESEAATAGAACEVTLIPHLTAYRVEEDDPALRRYRETAARAGITARTVRNFGGSDTNTLRRNGIAGITAANGMHRAHSCEEYTTVDELVKAAAVIRNLME